MQDLIVAIQTNMKQQKDNIRNIEKALGECRENDRQYKRAFARKLAELKINKESATLSKALAEGDDHVSDLAYSLQKSDDEVSVLRLSFQHLSMEYATLRDQIAAERRGE